MMTDSRDYDLELQRIVEGLVDSILEAPEEEIDADLRAAGDDPEAVADRLGAKLRETVEDYRGGRMARSYVRIQQKLLLMRAHPFELPETEGKRLRLLAAALHGKPQLEEMLAVHLQDIERLPDEEVKSYLEQLAEMGLLEGSREDSSEGEE